MAAIDCYGRGNFHGGTCLILIRFIYMTRLERLDGIANAPAAIIGVMRGENIGKMLVKLA